MIIHNIDEAVNEIATATGYVRKRYLLIVDLDEKRTLYISEPKRWWHYLGWMLAGAKLVEKEER